MSATGRTLGERLIVHPLLILSFSLHFHAHPPSVPPCSTKTPVRGFRRRRISRLPFFRVQTFPPCACTYARAWFAVAAAAAAAARTSRKKVYRKMAAGIYAIRGRRLFPTLLHLAVSRRRRHHRRRLRLDAGATARSQNDPTAEKAFA